MRLMARVMVNSLLSVRPEMSDIPQALVLGLALCNIFVNDMNSGIESTFSKFVYDTKPNGVVDIQQGKDAIQRNEEFEKWACVNLMKINKTKC